MRFTKEIQERIRERADNYTEKARHNKMISVKDSYCDGIIEVLDNPLEYDLITANTKERGLIELALERHIDSLKNRFENEKLNSWSTIWKFFITFITFIFFMDESIPLIYKIISLI